MFKNMSWVIAEKAVCGKEYSLLSTRVAATAVFIGLGLILIVFSGGSPALAQSAQAISAPPLAFEVASIKPSGDIQALVASGKMPILIPKIDDSQMNVHFMSLEQLIVMAYEVKSYQVSGPDWMKTTRFDIEAKLPDGAKKDQVPAMLRALLEDRFKLTIHRETREHPVYALIVGKDGSKLVPSPPDTPVDPDRTPDKNETVVDTPDGKVSVRSTGRGEGATFNMSGGRAGNVKVSMSNGVMHMEASKMTMALLAQQLSPMLDRPVIDMTELKGSYVVSLELSMADMMSAARASGMMVRTGPEGGGANAAGTGDASDPSGFSIFASIQKLGLKLDKQKLPLEFIVVDHLEKVPTEN
jgi:uncharacterized protein (TIGR03435 family)